MIPTLRISLQKVALESEGMLLLIERAALSPGINDEQRSPQDLHCRRDSQPDVG